VADALFLSLWFPSFELDDMLPRALAVMRQFPFSVLQPGITYVAMHPVSWNEPTIFEQRFTPGVPPERAVVLASDLLHGDYAYSFEAFWDLWILPPAQHEWMLQPSLVKFLVHGVEFEDGVYQHEGHVEVDFGIDSPFLQDEVQLTGEAEDRVRSNVQKLVDFTNKAEKSSGASGRLLWSESEENLAQKLLACRKCSSSQTPPTRSQSVALTLGALVYFVRPPSTFSLSVAPAWAAASSAVFTRNGEQET